MCGIIGGYSNQIEPGIKALLHRGPDAQGLVKVGKLTFGHTRLAILDLDPRSNQPFTYGQVTLVFNGEIWNYKQVRAELQQLGYSFKTTGDTEVVAAALDYWGVEALPRLNGMFALAWTTDGETLYLARDRFGEIPLHIARQKPFTFASEKKALLAIGASPKAIDDLPPGYYARVTPTSYQPISYYDVSTIPASISGQEARSCLFQLIGNGSTERAISDVPVCTLLSGGIDRAIPGLVAYTAVFNPKSQDLKNARLTAEYLGIELREVKVPLPTSDDLSRVIRCIEMPYKAQIEIGWPCLKLAEAMQADGFKVTFSGEGSDELWASYGFAYHALKTQNWHSYRKELFLSQARKNFARCNKIFMAHSIECRLPFLHPALVEFAISLPQSVVQEGKGRPKAIIQDAFRDKIPQAVTHRPKVAFQDGLGIKEAITKVLPNPGRFYNAEYSRYYS
jgi:asparagine synthase (glutamine-hydrolysing)